MQVFHISSLENDRQTYAEPFHEFLRTPNMNVGLYHLEAGSLDTQGAHQVDVLFHVLHGAASLRVGDTDLAVTAGSVVYVQAGVTPHFFDISATLDVLTIFAPAEAVPTIQVQPSAG